MEGGPNSENRITKAERFPQGTAKKLISSKKINRNGKRSYKETV